MGLLRDVRIGSSLGAIGGTCWVVLVGGLASLLYVLDSQEHRMLHRAVGCFERFGSFAKSEGVHIVTASALTGFGCGIVKYLCGNAKELIVK